MSLKKGWLARQFDHVTNDVQAWPEWMKREAGFGEYRPVRPEAAQQAGPRKQVQQNKTLGACPPNKD